MSRTGKVELIREKLVTEAEKSRKAERREKKNGTLAVQELLRQSAETMERAVVILDNVMRG